MKSGYTHITMVVDRSGSMSSIQADAQGGINTLIKEQKEVPGTATFDLWQFNTGFEHVINTQDISLVSESYRLVPMGGTALLDAIGNAIDHTGNMLRNMPEDQRPEHVIFVITTDGEENSSREFNLAQIREKISTQQNTYKWKFIFLAANQDAFQAGYTMGVAAATTSNYAATSTGIRSAYDGASYNLTAMRTNTATIATNDAEDIDWAAEKAKQKKDLKK